MTPVTSITHSISGLAWRWRGGNMDMSGRFGAMGGLSDDLVDQLLLSRGVPHDDLERHRRPTLRDFLPDPSLFRDMDVAARRLADAVVRGEAITVYGDYDVDGATSAALLLRLLRALGVEGQAYIPDRLLEGYGPSGEALVRLGREGSQLIVTVDCGAMAHEALGQARDAGIDVIVVDHHKCSPELPRRSRWSTPTASMKPMKRRPMAIWLPWASPSCWQWQPCACCAREAGSTSARCPISWPCSISSPWGRWPTWRSSRASTAHSWRKG
jgi:hypothetical protein